MMVLIWMSITVVLLFFVQQRIYYKWWNRNLFVSVDFKQTNLFEGDQGTLTEVIENRKRLPLPTLRVKFRTDRNLVFSDTMHKSVTDQYYRNDIFYIGGGERITRTLTFTGNKRGYYKINGIDVITGDLFLSASMTENLETDKYVYVYPKPARSEEFRLSMQQLSGEVLTRQHSLEDPFEHRGIRPYQPCDEMRSVNWKATAKTLELKVNQKNYTSLKTVRIFFNIEDTGIRKKEAAVEESLRIVAGLAEFFLLQGMRVACYGNGVDIVNSEPVEINAGGSRDQMERIYRALARVDIKQPAVSFPQQFRQKLFFEEPGVMTFFAAPNMYDDFTALVREYDASGQDYLWFFPCEKYSIPKLPEELQAKTRIITI